MAELVKKQSVFSAKEFQVVIRVLKTNWWIPVILLPIFYAAGTFYTYRLTDTYSASTQVLFKPNDVYYQNNVLNESNFYTGTYIDNMNETRILMSYDLSKRVIEKLHERLQVSYFIVGKVRTTEQFSGMPFKIHADLINPGFYEQMFDLRVVDYRNYKIAYDDGSGNIIELQGEFGKPLPDPNLPIVITWIAGMGPDKIQSFTNLLYQFQVHSKDMLIGNLRANLTVDNQQYTNILVISLSDIIPERAVLLLDTLNALYSRDKLQSKYDLNDRTIEYIDVQLDQITNVLNNIEDTMQNYKERKAIINLDWEQNDFLGKISGFDNEKSSMELQISALDDLEKYIIEDKDPQFLPPNVYIFEKQGYLLTAVSDLYQKQIELNKLYGLATEDHPTIKELKAAIKKTKQDLLVYISNTRKATKDQIQNVNSQIMNYISLAKSIPSKRRGELNIQRKVNVSENLYNFLLEKRATTKIARASIIPDVRIIEAPRNIGVIAPDKPAISKGFVSVGLLLSLGIILIRAFLFTKIKTVEHLKEITDLPLIGVLPQVKEGEGEGIVVEQSPNSLVAEAFRNFRTNLQYANVGIDAKTFLITSFLPGEGKTFTSVNLAVILARSGKKTVILELDLHKPRIYKRFGLPVQNEGITTYITGQNAIEDIISPTMIPNLSCIFSGPVPPNPSEFVLSEKMKMLIDYAKQNFDYVIIDTPPAGLLSDSVYLIQNVDASIFVINTKTGNKRVINFIEDLIIANNLKNITLLLNGVKKLSNRYYYQGYGYNYGYGYGYGYGKGYGYRK